MGVGEAKTDAKQLDAAVEELTTSPASARRFARRRKSVAQFKIREGMPIGAKVTLRGARMYEFLDRLVSIALPRIRDFRGLNPRLVRRPRQLLARRPRADHLPGDQLRRHPAGSRPRRDDHDQRPRPTTTPARCCRLSACRSERRGPEEGLIHWRRQASSSSKSGRRSTRSAHYTRCNRCGRPRAVFRKFGLCRICLRELAHQGAIPGMTKSSW